MLSSNQTRQDVVFEKVRRSILPGTLHCGARLPPTRGLAQELGVARQTVVLAYERLAAEGYVRGRTGSGTYVAAEIPDQVPVPAQIPRVAAMSISARGARLANLPVTATARSLHWACCWRGVCPRRICSHTRLGPDAPRAC